MSTSKISYLWVGKCVSQVCSFFVAATLNDLSKAAILLAICLFAAPTAAACVVCRAVCVGKWAEIESAMKSSRRCRASSKLIVLDGSSSSGRSSGEGSASAALCSPSRLEEVNFLLLLVGGVRDE